jgi:hypothetical protein
MEQLPGGFGDYAGVGAVPDGTMRRAGRASEHHLTVGMEREMVRRGAPWLGLFFQERVWASEGCGQGHNAERFHKAMRNPPFAFNTLASEWHNCWLRGSNADRANGCVELLGETVVPVL